ncbi:hypothetical protein D3C76_1690540 [compost metagenome]
MDEAGVNTWDADNAAATHSSNALAQRLAAATFDLQCRRYCFGSAAFGFKANRINYRINATHA